MSELERLKRAKKGSVSQIEMDSRPAPRDVAAGHLASGDWAAGAARSSSGAVWRSVALIAAATLIVYANSLLVGFLLDDFWDILDNPWVHNCWPPWRCVVRISGDGLTFHSRPVVSLSFGVNYWLAEQTPWSYHATNVGIHLVAALALFGLARRTLAMVYDDDMRLRATPLALIIALVWAVHPLNTQAVTYTVQRFESMMGMFYLLAAYAASRGMSGGSRAWSAAAIAACFLAMGSKEVAFTAPVVILLYDRTFVAGSFAAALRARPGLYAGLAGCWLVFTPLYLSTSGRGFAGSTAQSTWYQYALDPARRDFALSAALLLADGTMFRLRLAAGPNAPARFYRRRRSSACWSG